MLSAADPLLQQLRPAFQKNQGLSSHHPPLYTLPPGEGCLIHLILLPKAPPPSGASFQGEALYSYQPLTLAIMAKLSTVGLRAIGDCLFVHPSRWPDSRSSPQQSSAHKGYGVITLEHCCSAQGPASFRAQETSTRGWRARWGRPAAGAGLRPGQ